MKSNRLPSSTIGHNWRKCYWIACHLALQACEVLCALDSHPWMIWLSYKRPRVWPNTYWSASHRSRNVQMVWFSAMMAVIIANGNAAVHQIWMLFYTKHQSFYDEFPLKTCSFSFIFCLPNKICWALCMRLPERRHPGVAVQPYGAHTIRIVCHIRETIIGRRHGDCFAQPQRG